MADPLLTISATLRDAFATVTGLPADEIDPAVRPSDRADAQSNGALALAKRIGRNPRELAQAVVDTGVLAGACSAAEVAGPGFINLTFEAGFLAEQLHALEEAVVDYQFRFEGDSDPGDEAIVLGISCAGVQRGVLVSGFGPSADPEHAAILRALTR